MKIRTKAPVGDDATCEMNSFITYCVKNKIKASPTYFHDLAYRTPCTEINTLEITASQLGIKYS